MATAFPGVVKVRWKLALTAVQGSAVVAEREMVVRGEVGDGAVLQKLRFVSGVVVFAAGRRKWRRHDGARRRRWLMEMTARMEEDGGGARSCWTREEDGVAVRGGRKRCDGEVRRCGGGCHGGGRREEN